MKTTLEHPAPQAPARTEMPDWGAAGWAGLAGGLAFGTVELLMRDWMPSKLVAALVLGNTMLQPPPEYKAIIDASAVAVHFTLSLIFARILILLVHRHRLSYSVEEGAAYGLGIYLLVFHLLAPAFPWLAVGRGLPTMLAHAVYGVTVVLAYRKLAGVKLRYRGAGPMDSMPRRG